MYLQRVRVPDFRVLKDVDITFDKELTPKAFPLGSQNGGGKSTLLQLIFILLHCPVVPERIPFLKNLISGFKVKNDNEKSILAIIDIWYNNENIEIEFFLCKNLYIQKILNIGGSNNDERNDLFAILKELSSLDQRKTEISSEKFELEFSGNNSEKTKQQIEYLDIEIASNSLKKKALNNLFKKIDEDLKLKNIIYIINYSSQENAEEEEALFCSIKNLDPTDSESFLQEISQKTFLAAPSTQVFIFLSQQARKLLFKEKERSPKETYSSHINTAKSKLPGFFVYDFLTVDILVNYFKLARDRDFQEAIETGEYGNNYKLLLNDLNFLLVNKQINLTPDLSGVTFKINRDNEVIELAPEDLSHGELKRLSIYMWLKYRNIENAIVLMDEVEIAFHPDWQYQIVSDLNQWEPSNQYILATHSYELCQALTPAHVKELEPRLMKQSSGQV